MLVNLLWRQNIQVYIKHYFIGIRVCRFFIRSLSSAKFAQKPFWRVDNIVRFLVNMLNLNNTKNWRKSYHVATVSTYFIGYVRVSSLQHTRTLCLMLFTFWDLWENNLLEKSQVSSWLLMKSPFECKLW